MFLKVMTADRVFDYGYGYQIQVAVELGYIYIISHDMVHVIYT
jgi:hypothetical protein